MNYETILYETDGGKARITLNRPEKLNAISWQMQQELHDALWAADRDPRVHVAIIRGAGARSPPATTSRRRPARADPRRDRPLDGARHLVPRAGAADADGILDMHKPVIGQVHGYCLAGGTDLAFLCDIVIAAEDARIGFPPVRAMGSPVGPHVDVPRRPAVGEAHAPHRRH